MSGDVSPYLGLITAEHQGAPNFLAAVSAACQPFADLIATLKVIPSVYDLDNAQGAQLDAIGQWVGVSRQLATPLTGVYFALDTASLGFDQGTWQGPYDPSTGLVSLPDDAFLTLIRGKVAANNWDGTIPSAYTIWGEIFSSQGVGILIQDNGDMTMVLALTGPIPSAVTQAMFSQGLFELKPATVQIAARYAPSVAGAPYFGFDVENSAISGFDVGAWGTSL